MPTITKNLRTTTLECVEKDGAIIRLVTQTRVTGVTTASAQALLTALNAAGVPQEGAKVTGFPNLVLRTRNVRLAEEDKETYDIDLTYLALDSKNEGQSFDTPEDGFVVGEVSVDVQQVTTNKDGQGNQITVKHLWPTDDPDHPGEEHTQGGEVDVFVPQRTFTIRGKKLTSRPWLLANGIIGKVNSTAWSGAGPREWLCTGVSWNIHDRDGPNVYSMEFQFQHNSETWDPVVVFIDPRTSKPPKNLAEGAGVKKVLVLEEIPFESILPTRMQGA